MSNVVINPFVFGAAAAFSPSDISGLEFWIDADDSSFTLTGSLVDQWNDISGNSRHVTGSGTARPTKTTVGGLEVVDFDGSNDVLTWSGTSFDLSTGWTICAVMAHNSLSSTGNTWFSITDGAGAGQDVGVRCRYEGNASSPDWAVRGDFPTLNLSQDMGQAVGTTQVWAILSGASGSAAITDNNNYPTEETDTYTDEPSSACTDIAVCSRLSGSTVNGSHADVQIRALLVYSNDITGDSKFSDLVTWLDDKIT